MSYVIKNFPIDQTTWWPITAPIDCKGFSVRPAADCHVRTDATDSLTEDDIPAGTQEVIIIDFSPVDSTYHPVTVGGSRWKAGTVICYLMSQAGAQTVVARFVQ